MDTFGFPTDSKKKKTGRLGEAHFEHFVKTTLGWDYRRVPQESDFGIDGHIDVIDGLKATGLSLAVQVKCGASYLAKRTAHGIRFEGEHKHLNYYLHLRVPVLLIVIGEDGKEGYWEVFELEKTSQAGDSKWWMEIPFRNKLNASIVPVWQSIAGPIVDHTEMIRRSWRVAKLFEDASFIVFSIPRKEVQELSMETVSFVISKLTRSTELLLSKRLSVEIYFPEYADDERELYEIPEVRNWFQASIFKAQIPWFYFLRAGDGMVALKLLHLCSVPIEIQGREEGNVWTSFDPRTPESKLWIDHNFNNLNLFTSKFGLPEEINKETSLTPLNALLAVWKNATKSKVPRKGAG